MQFMLREIICFASETEFYVLEIFWGYFMNLLLVFHIIPFKWTKERYVPEGSIGATQ